MTKKISVHISYAEEDRDAASKIYDDMKANGISVWMADKDILLGKDKLDAAKKSIRNCNYFITLLSRHSLTQEGSFHRDLKIALQVMEEKPYGDVFLIPVRLDNHSLPPKIANIQHVDLFSDYEKGLKKILQSVRWKSQPGQTHEKPMELILVKNIDMKPQKQEKEKPEQKQRNKFAPIDHKMCNRGNEYDVFIDFFEDRCDECPSRPHFYILPGELRECPDSFIDRIRDTHIKSYIEKRIKESNISKSDVVNAFCEKVKWNINSKTPKNKRSSRMRAAIHQAFPMKDDIPDERHSVYDMFRYLEAHKYEVVIFIHDIHADGFNKSHMHWYMNDFWGSYKCREDDDMPIFIVFFNILIPDSDKIKGLRRFTWVYGKWRILRQLKSLHEAMSEECHCCLFEELKSVKNTDIYDWIEHYAKGILQKEKLDLIYETICKGNKWVCMSDVEAELLKIIAEKDRELFKNYVKTQEI